MMFSVILVLLSTAGVGVHAAGHDLGCYNSTLAIVLAQLQDPPVKNFQICPQTTIDIGIPIDDTFANFAQGDVPLTVLHDDVTIQCGGGGDPNDSCVLNGGAYQFVTVGSNPFLPGQTITTNNLMLKGLTFTGQLADLPGLSSVAAYFSASGTNMTIENCLFRSLDANSVISNSLSLLTTIETYPPFSSDVTLQDCSFENVTYGTTVVGNSGQTMKINSARMNQIQYKDCGCEGYIGLIQNIGGVMSLVASTFADAEVVSAVAYWSDAVDVSAPSDAVSTFEYSDNIESAGITFVDADNRTDYCEEGLLKDNLNEDAFGECLDLFVQAVDSATTLGHFVVTFGLSFIVVMLV
jgi:hypothetical protein